MHTNFKTPYRSFAQALAQLIEDGDTSVKECASIGGRTKQTIHNWISESSPVNEEVAHRIMREHPSDNVRLALAQARLSGSEFQVTTAEGETDVDHDGRTTAKDVLLTVAEMCANAAQEAKDAASACVDGKLSEEEAQQVVQGLQEVIQKCHQGIGQVTKATAAKFRARLTA